jgi:hypothetical protein
MKQSYNVTADSADSCCYRPAMYTLTVSAEVTAAVAVTAAVTSTTLFR